MTAPFGGPVVPEVNITTPAPFSSKLPLVEMYMSSVDMHGPKVDGLMGIHLNFVLRVSLVYFSIPRPSSRAPDPARIATASHLSVK